MTLDSARPELYYRARFQVVSSRRELVGLLRARMPRTARSHRRSFPAPAGSGSATTSPACPRPVRGLRHSGTGTRSSCTSRQRPVCPLADVYLDGQLVASRTDVLGGAPVGKLELGDPSVGRTFDVAFDGVVADPGFIADLAPPTAPATLQATSVAAHEVDLSWSAATDDVGVTAYRIYRNGLALATSTAPP